MINNIHRALTANKKFYSLLALCAFFFIPNAAKATDYMIGNESDATLSAVLPIVPSSSSYTAITQQIYTAADFGLVTPSGDITDITFYYGGKSNNTNVASVSRTIEIWLKETDDVEFDINSDSHKFYYKADKGTKVYDGTFVTGAVTSGNIYPKTVHLASAFNYGGTKNILMTVIDKTDAVYSDTNLRFVLTEKSSDKGHFVHIHWLEQNASDFSTYRSNLSGKVGEIFSSPLTDVGQKASHKWVNKVTFSISVTIPAPTNLAASSITTSSATLSWDAAAGATGYNVRWGKTSGSLDHSQNNVAATSLAISGLDDGETYYFDVQTITAGGTSAWASEANFNTTAITHIHDGISFSKWASTTTMPTSGNYYLNDDVAFDIMSSDVTLTGNLNLCLNGKTADLYGSKIIVPDGKTLAIYDNVGGGKITGVVASDVGIADTYAKALIVVRSGGELELKQGTIENTYIPDADGSSYAIYSNGTIHLSGSVLINSNNTDIYLYSTNVITLDGAISNAEKHTVYKLGGDITYGWSTYMSGEDPRDYFESSNSARAVFLDDDEAALRILLRLSENSNNSSIADNKDQVIDVALTRSLTSSQYNTFCLPFNLNNAQLEAIFGVGYDLREFDYSNFDGETLELVFVRRYELTEGAPYLIKPSVDVVNPYFEGVTIHDGNPGSDEFDANIYFHSTFAPTELEGGNKNLLFLGANNELFWPESTGNLKAFRAYFEVKGEARKAVHARISKHEDTATGIDQINEKMEKCENAKIIKDGQLFILRDNKTYNVLGLECK